MTISGHNGPISGVATNRNNYVLSAGYDNRVILWEHRERRAVSRAWHDHLANSCSFSPDGRLALSASSDHTVRLWTIPDLKLAAVLTGHEDDVEMAVFHPTRPLVATASRDHRVRVFGFDGALVVTMTGHEADVISVQWNTEGDELVSSSDDGTIRRWSLETGEQLEELDMAGVETDTIAVAPDGRIFAGDDDGLLTAIAGDRRETVSAHEAGIKRLVLDSAEPLLVSLSYDRTMRLWNVAGDRPKPVATATLPDDVWPRSCAFLDSQTLVFATFGASYRTYDVTEGRWHDEQVEATPGVNAVAEIDGHVLSVGDAGRVIDAERGEVVGEVGSLANFLTPLGDLVLTGGQLGRVFDARTGRVLHQHRSPLNCGVRFEHDGREHALIGTYTGEGLVFTTDGDGIRLAAELRLHDNAVKAVAVSGGTLFSVAADAGATWVSTGTLEVVARVSDGHSKIANGCTGLGDEQRFASVSRDLQLRIWDVGQCTLTTPTPHDHSVKCVAASPDGRFVATASYNGFAAVYDRATDSWPVQVRLSMTGISSLAYSERRGEFLAGSYDGTVHTLPVLDASAKTQPLKGLAGVVR
ncbi:WD40 repeat domain-containing protein [Amycolatopsis sp. H20-H5]|uniref:WD40 repeat domain-containing protein n=1 Tax=Amycolatopsis sp. H20-H5 TaxID=3046309 RepID=UPI002DBF1302|nr:WD40 repeat domain-containing protein [Amycolatopsis sp. H20-H5]MEC3979072.1 WD40 repeat domain-containing protein [Amycolatopsis sp. H20-H5]